MSYSEAKTTVLFLSYNGFLEPLLSSQAVPYMKEIARKGFEFILLTYEKDVDLKKISRLEIAHLKKELAEQGIEWHYLKYHKTPRLLATIFDLFRGLLFCLYHISAGKVRIVHMRGVTPGSIMLFIPRIFGFKLLFDMRGRLAEEMAAGGLWKEEELPYKLIKFAEKKLLRKADAVTVLTKRHLKYNRTLGYFRERNIPTEMIPCCVDTDKFHPDETLARKLKDDLGLQGEFLLMYPGKLSTFYLVDCMLDFYLVLLENIPDALFFILTPDDPADLLSKADDRGIDRGRLKIFRNVKFELMPQYLRLADAGIFFINAYNKLGSSPIKLGEFLSSGVPVIVNPGVGDTEEVVRNDRVGVVVESFEGHSYVKAIADLFELKKEGNTLRERCRSVATKQLSLVSGSEKYYEIYSALVEER